MHTHRRLVVVLSPLVAAGLVLAVPATSTGRSPGARSGSAHGWVTVSGKNVDSSLTVPSIARFGHAYEVVWQARTGAATEAIQGRRLTSSGKTSGGVVTVVGAWPSLRGDPTILGYAGQHLVAFAGAQNSGPYTTGAEFYTTSASGTVWTLSTGSLSAANGADQDTGNAVTNDGGTLIAGMAEANGVRYHAGISASNPAPGTDPLTSTTGNSSYTPGLGLDRSTSRVWALWFSNDGAGGHDGVWAQPVRPALGSLIHAPGSSAKGGTTARGVAQDLSAASRVGGGVYTAYVTPASRSVDVWKVGAAKPLATLKDLKGPSNVTVTAAPKGRIWVFWRDNDGWRATRSNRTATRFGAVVKLRPPSGMQVGFGVAGDGSRGPLEAVGMVATSSGQTRVVAQRVRPHLSVHRSPKSVKPGGSFTVTVTDAGDAVIGAHVHFAGKTYKTGRKGSVKIKIARSTGRGKRAVTVTATGYAKATVTVKVS
ncbi:MAG TPA: hypothetical protein VHW64_07320 [Nocardioides sp.]|jgi:hypothetical protein|uniref:hypothetical protein n=1 Tax=Nocardioides sp. TaxID=35761 RepID=UPI002E2F822C|nr:hypothetical protein [Nocardioides sp.]HEX3930495.1 hypothetical protein [Nocardioides sp.]